MAVLDYVNGTLESARRQADRVVTPDSRQKVYEVSWSFAQERPILFSFLVAQGLFSFLPLLLFASFVLGIFSLAAISAVFFSLFWIGIAALVLASTLFVTSGLALLAWVWVGGAYLAASLVYGLVFASSGQAAGNKGEQQRLLSEKLARMVNTEPGSAVSEATTVGEKGEQNGGHNTTSGEKEETQSGSLILSGNGGK